MTPDPVEVTALRRLGLVWTGTEYEEENTLTERIDHAEAAREALRGAGDGRNFATDASNAAVAHAVLALVEQQRIQNIIALSQSVAGDGSRPLRHLAVIPVTEHDVGPRPEIAAALGIQAVEPLPVGGESDGA